MTIVLVEDDFDQADEIVEWLSDEFPAAVVERIATESEFHARIGDLAAQRPDLFIIDVMLRWTDPSPTMTDPPDEVREQGSYRAGFRCVKLILADSKLRDVPTIIFSMLDVDDVRPDLRNMPPTVRMVSKDGGRTGLMSITRILNAVRLRSVPSL